MVDVGVAYHIYVYEHVIIIPLHVISYRINDNGHVTLIMWLVILHVVAYHRHFSVYYVTKWVYVYNMVTKYTMKICTTKILIM